MVSGINLTSGVLHPNEETIIGLHVKKASNSSRSEEGEQRVPYFQRLQKMKIYQVEQHASELPRPKAIASESSRKGKGRRRSRPRKMKPAPASIKATEINPARRARHEEIKS